MPAYRGRGMRLRRTDQSGTRRGAGRGRALPLKQIDADCLQEFTHALVCGFAHHNHVLLIGCNIRVTVSQRFLGLNRDIIVNVVDNAGDIAIDLFAGHAGFREIFFANAFLVHHV